MITIATNAVQDILKVVWPFHRKKQTRERLRDFESDARGQAERFGPLNRRSIGIRTVEISRITGSVGRTSDFDADFHPVFQTTATKDRFQRVLRAMRNGESLPPIELYKLRKRYYVLDGHHRVGAARELGVESLEAEVTLFIPSGDPVAVRTYHERIAFEQATGLRSIGGSRPRTYRRLLVEIHDYRRKLADERGAPVDLPTAALQWYARIFLPAFAIVRNSKLQTYFPALRHADILASLWDEERIAQSRLQQTSGTGDESVADTQVQLMAALDGAGARAATQADMSADDQPAADPLN